MLSGLYTPPKILEMVNQQWGFRTRQTRKMGGKALSRSTIYKIFTKPFYYGWFEYPAGSGKWYQGKHQPMITQAEYNRVQTLLGRNGNPRPRSPHEFTFTGLIRCGECNRMVTAEEKHQIICSHCRFKFAYRQREECPRCQTPIGQMTNPLFLRYTYYHCSKSKKPACKQKCVSDVELEKQIAAYIVRVQISEKFRDWAITYLHELHGIESVNGKAIIEAQQKAYQDCTQKINNLVSLKTSPGNADGSMLSDEEYGKRRAELLKEKVALEELLRDAALRIDQQLRLTEKTFEFACEVQERFAKGNPKTKKEMLMTMGSNLTLKDKKLFIEAKKPFFILGEYMSVEINQNEPIEPENTGLTQERMSASAPMCPNWRCTRVWYPHLETL